MVITKGAERVAEVAARFTLDAMPGKQMAIDADLNAGLITDDEARRRRDKIQREADFYGSMDGASKFVKGDAVAGLIIVAINLVGGIAIGVVQQGMLVQRRAQHLHAAVDRRRPGRPDPGAADLDRHRHHRHPRGVRPELQPRPGHHAASCCASRARWPSPPVVRRRHGAVPGPAEAAVHPHRADPRRPRPSRCARAASARRPAWRSSPRPRPQRQLPAVPSTDQVTKALGLDTLELEIGYGLIPLVDENEGGELLKRVSLVRRQMAAELGLVLQPIRIRDSVQLASHEYCVKVKGVEVARSSLAAGSLLAMNPGDADPTLPGEPTVEPAFGLPALWISTRRARARRGRRLHGRRPPVDHHHAPHRDDPRARRRPARPPGRARAARPPQASATRRWSTSSCPTSARSATSTASCRALLAEGISIRDLGTVLETMGDRARLTKDPALLTEYAARPWRGSSRRRSSTRSAPSRSSCSSRASSRSSPTASCRRRTAPTSDSTPVGPRRLVRAVRDTMEHVTAIGHRPVLVCSPKVRRHLRALTAHAVPRLVVLSYNEILPSTTVETVGVVELVAEGSLA